MIRVDGARALGVLRAALVARGVAAEAAEHVAQSLVETSLRGVDSHGIHLFPHYCRAVEGGRINRDPRFRTEQGGAAVACIDADHGFGHHAGAVAMDLAVSYAAEAGIAAVGVRNSSHFGAAAYFALRAARRGLIGMSFTNADALVKAHGAKARFFGTNPICFCAPLEGEEPLCLDMATSQIAWNKLRNMADRGEALPHDVAYDAEGRSVTDPATAYSLAPVGSYKGYGLGLMVEVLCALLPDGPISPDILPMYGTDLGTAREVGHFFIAIDVSRFTDRDRFVRRLTGMVARLRALEPTEPALPVLVAGDPEKRNRAARVREGIPLTRGRFDELVAVAPDMASAMVRP